MFVNEAAGRARGGGRAGLISVLAALSAPLVGRPVGPPRELPAARLVGAPGPRAQGWSARGRAGGRWSGGGRAGAGSLGRAEV